MRPVTRPATPARAPAARGRLPSVRNPKSKIQNAFTLTELLVVIGLAVLVVTLAIPAFSVITGGRSIDAAENQVSALVARARADALGLQEPRGVAFFTDPGTGRVAAVEVYYDPENAAAAASLANRLELVPDRDEVLLPTGVGLQTLIDSPPANAYPYSLLGVVLFDGSGRLMIKRWEVIPANGSGANDLSNRVTPQPATPQQPAFADNSTIGFIMYDLEGFQGAAGGGNLNAARDWVRENGVPYLINRYNGTLLRGE